LENIPETKFKSMFIKWFKNKAEDYASLTLEDFFIGKYKRDIPRVLLYPVSKKAKNNYFTQEPLYRKKPTDPLVLGFKENAFNNNVFIRDIEPNDICLFIDADATRTKRSDFINNIKFGKLSLNRLVAFKITSSLYEKTKSTIIDKLYWKDEIAAGKVIYPYFCTLENKPFIDITNKTLPYIDKFTDEKWEALRSCIQYGEYKEISALDFTILISNIKY